jgi:hypothetical protein
MNKSAGNYSSINFFSYWGVSRNVGPKNPLKTHSKKLN